MAPHLLTALQDALTPDLAAALADSHGTPHATLRSAHDAWMALLLAALAHLALDDAGPHAVRTLLTRDTALHAAAATTAFHAAPGRDTLQALTPLGSQLLAEWVGAARTARVTLALAAVSGLAAAAAQQLAGVLTAVGTSVLAQALRPQLREPGNDPALLTLLRAQAPDLHRQLDARLTTAAGLGSPSALLSALGSGDKRPAPSPSLPTARAPTPESEGRSRWARGLGGGLTVVLAALAASQLATCDSRDRLAATLPASAASTGQAAAPAPAGNALSAQVFFDNAQSAVGRDGLQRLATVRAWLAAEPSRQVRITGYTDTSGDHELNQALAHARAQAVRRVLEDAGVGADRILMHPPESVQLGADMPAAQARRVDIVSR